MFQSRACSNMLLALTSTQISSWETKIKTSIPMKERETSLQIWMKYCSTWTGTMSRCRACWTCFEVSLPFASATLSNKRSKTSLEWGWTKTRRRQSTPLTASSTTSLASATSITPLNVAYIQPKPTFLSRTGHQSWPRTAQRANSICSTQCRFIPTSCSTW